MNLNTFAERRWLPDSLIRFGIRQLLQKRHESAASANENKTPAQIAEIFADKMRRLNQLAEETVAANEQHYEVPAKFYQNCLGPRLKYSSGYWPPGVETLAESEEAMLRLTCERAELTNEMRILELGCGWGSLSLWMAEQYPQSDITVMSNSASQKEYIEQQAAVRHFTNLTVITADINEFVPEATFDRVVSVEMFEHVRNHERLFERIAGWLSDDGKLFSHVFCHRWLPYLFEKGEGNDWMARHFFTGGMMPSEPLFSQYNQHLKIANQWWVEGEHYARTCNAWLEELDNNLPAVLDALSDHPDGAQIQSQRWRIFFMACAELFDFREQATSPRGDIWGVSHYLFTK